MLLLLSLCTIGFIVVESYVATVWKSHPTSDVILSTTFILSLFTSVMIAVIDAWLLIVVCPLLVLLLLTILVTTEGPEGPEGPEERSRDIVVSLKNQLELFGMNLLDKLMIIWEKVKDVMVQITTAGSFITIILVTGAIIVYLVVVWGFPDNWILKPLEALGFNVDLHDSDFVMDMLNSGWEWCADTAIDILFSIANVVRMVGSIVVPVWNFLLDVIQEAGPKLGKTFYDCAPTLSDVHGIMSTTQIAMAGYGGALTLGRPATPSDFRNATKLSARALTESVVLLHTSTVCVCNNTAVEKVLSIILFPPYMTDTFADLFYHFIGVIVRALSVIRSIVDQNDPMHHLLAPLSADAPGLWGHLVGTVRSLGIIVDRWIFLVLKNAANLIGEISIIKGIPLHIETTPTTGIFAFLVSCVGYIGDVLLHIPIAMGSFIWTIVGDAELNIDPIEPMSRWISDFVTSTHWVAEKIILFIGGDGAIDPHRDVTGSACSEMPPEPVFMVSCSLYASLGAMFGTVDSILSFVVGYLAIIAHELAVETKNHTSIVDTWEMIALRTSAYVEKSTMIPPSRGPSLITHDGRTLVRIAELPYLFAEGREPNPRTTKICYTDFAMDLTKLHWSD